MMHIMDEHDNHLTEDHEPACCHSAKLNNESPTDVIDRTSKNPAMWGNIPNVVRHPLPDDSLNPGDLDVAEAYAGPSKPEPKSPAESEDSELSSFGSSVWSERSEGTQKAVNEEEEVMTESKAASESGKCTHHDHQTGGKLVRELDVGEARDFAAQALAAIPEDETPHLPPIRLPSSTKREFDDDSLATPARSSHSPRSLRSPIWRSLVPVSPPHGGYWTPSTTEEGEKNTPMCPPCRTGKKGRCYGGLPCDRCKEKEYSKERCEGSLVFRFSPRTKRGAKEAEKTAKKSPADSARWKRDAFGRFI
jgi:hypothetical protein